MLASLVLRPLSSSHIGGRAGVQYLSGQADDDRVLYGLQTVRPSRAGFSATKTTLNLARVMAT
jgi:hypothetical protein